VEEEWVFSNLLVFFFFALVELLGKIILDTAICPRPV
jgi:hypothetical protein